MEASNDQDGDRGQDKAQQVAGDAQEKVQQAASDTKDRARAQIDERSTQAGEQVTTSAGDLRSVAEHLRSEGKDQPAKMADQAADRAERLGGYLQDSDADRILRDVEDFGRRQPLAMVAGGLALGFAASRFMRASSQSRSGQDRPQLQAQPQPEPQRTSLPAGTAAPQVPNGAPVPVGSEL